MAWTMVVHGVTLSAQTDGSASLSVTGAGITLTVAQLAAVAEVAGAMATLLKRAGEAGATWQAATAATVTTSARPHRGPGRPRSDGPAPATAVVKVQSPRGPGRPRQDGARSAVGAQAPSGTRTPPGRPRQDGASGPVKVAAARQSTRQAAPKATKARRGPGRPRGATRTRTPRAPAPARATPGVALVDAVDAWMSQHPGPKSLADLVSAAVEQGWSTDAASAEATVKSTIPRHRDRFVLVDEGYQRRADLQDVARPTSAPKRVPRGERKTPTT